MPGTWAPQQWLSLPSGLLVAYAPRPPKAIFLSSVWHEGKEDSLVSLLLLPGPPPLPTNIVFTDSTAASPGLETLTFLYLRFPFPSYTDFS